jgi:hypothetical protein
MNGYYKFDKDKANQIYQFVIQPRRVKTLKHLTDTELRVMAVSARNAYQGDEPNHYHDSSYHFWGERYPDDELVVEHLVFERFLTHPHASESDYK